MSEAGRLHKQGIDHYMAGRYDDAARSFEEAARAAESSDDTRARAEALNDLGVTLRQLEGPDRALSTLQQAREIFASLGDQKGIAQAMGNIGSVYEDLEEPEKAAEAYRESAELFEELGEPDMAMHSRQALSRLHLKEKRWLAAIGDYEDGVDQMPDTSIKKKLIKSLFKLTDKILGVSGSDDDDDDKDDDKDKEGA